MTYTTDEDDTTKGEERESGPDARAELLEKAKRCFKLCVEAEASQREREKADLEFQVPERQWTDEARSARNGTASEGVPTPARPILSIPKLDQPIRMVLNQERQAHLGINIHPLTADADDDTAEVLQGLYRRIERDSQASLARSWAFDRAVKCGRGAYRVNTRYDETSEDPFDQEITIDRILHQEAVYFDPAATKWDFSDGKWAFVTSWVPLKDFRREHPGAQVGSRSDMTFQDAIIDAPEWIRDAGGGKDGDDEGKAVLVAEYWYKSYETVTVEQEGQTRQREKVTVRFCKLTGFEVLEEQDWNGRYIPLIPVLGRELQPFDGERRWCGIIGPNKDAQRVFNYAASNAIELVALEPRAPFIGAEGQFEGHESEWQQANTRNFPYLEYKAVKDGTGQLLPPPQRAQVDVGRLGPTMTLLQQADQFLQAGTAIYDPSLGRSSTREKSGRAINALQQQGDVGTSDYLANLADISLGLEARVVLDLIPAIYDRPGRLARVLDIEGDSKPVMLNAPYVVDPKTKRPTPAPAGGQGVKHHDLRKGIYAVSVKVGRSRQTALEQGAEELGSILEAQPQLMPILGPIYFKFRDFPGHDEISELLTKLRDKQWPGLVSDENAGPTPEQAQAQIQALQQQQQLMQAQLQQAIEVIKTDQAKQQAMLQKAEMDNASRERIAQMDAQSKILLRKLDAMEALLTRGHESAMAGAQAAHESDQASHQAAHEVALAADQAGHDMAKAAAAPGPGMEQPDLSAMPQSVGQPLGPDEGAV